MRKKLALTMALASFGVITALGVGFAGAENATTTESVEAVAPLSTPPATAVEPTACSNELDDDQDGLIDSADPDCASPADESEAGVAPAPEATPNNTVEAPPAPAAPADQGSGFEAGATIAGGGGEAHHNESLGDTSGGSGNSGGGVSAPSATGGVQLHTKAASGGSQYSAGGTPTEANPTTTIAPFGPAPLGVPNFIIDSFEIPPFLLPIYQACGTEYGIPWEVLASINKIESGFGTNMGPSSAGAIGWMQFLPSSWEAFGLDANGDGQKDPYNPVDAICAAAHYLDLSGGSSDLYKAIFSYNHADWYVQEVLSYARAYGKLPPDLVGSLTGLTEGAHFPVAADASYADDLSAREALKRSAPGAASAYGDAAEVISSSPTRRGINIFADQGAPVVAVNDGVIKALGDSAKLGKYIVLEDAYGNRYTYAELGEIVQSGGGILTSHGAQQPVVDTENLRPRLYALPNRAAGNADGDSEPGSAGSAQTLKVGSRVVGGAVIARIGGSAGGADPHLNFSIAPAGAGAHRIDPKPILDGWKLLEATAIYRANGKSAFANDLSVSGVLLLPKDALEQRVLHDKNLSIYDCGREDIASGRIDRRVLAVLEYLVSKGFQLTITSLECGHSVYSSSGYVSEHSTGDAVDIATIDGVPVTGHQGPGTLADALIKTVLRLQGTMQPHQVISLEDLPGETSFALPDHYDHVHIGYSPAFEIEYVSPFLSASTGRIDQGVDFTGTGPIAAVGDAEILATGAPGWPEGGGVLYKLLSGSRAGQIIFVYEGVAATVHAGQHVSAGDQIATFVPGGSIEMGFADASGVPLSHGEYDEGDETEWGREMASFLTSIGGASGLSTSLGQLSPDKWNRLMQRLGEIDNPQVPTTPSQFAEPDSKAKQGKNGNAGQPGGD
ncbi:MAG TPA: peptidoglycan DD-metalloendopeptidase family protein [Solirubrobacterales bacterium]|jgi:murein DD-endopeptidase MepM/ murein hydrolase activator NlpD